MARILLATASVHTTAAACDYLEKRVGADDTVVVLTVEDGLHGRDAGDAANVARTRLFEPEIETVIREGDPAAVIRRVADERRVDEIVVGRTRGDPETAGTPPGSTVRTLLSETTLPVVVLATGSIK